MAIAYVLINCVMRVEKAVIDKLKTFDAVKEAIGTFGVYDILVKLEADSDQKLTDVITQKIRKMDNVRTTTTLMVMQEWE